MPGASAPLLRARPSATGPALAAGEIALANGALAYRPAKPAAPALPLLVHAPRRRPLSAGFPPDRWSRVADRLGVMLVAPQSRDQTWDLVQNMQTGRRAVARRLDAHRLDQSLADLFSRSAVDPARVVLLGFSDGASYALSLGLANPKLFTAVIALSPGNGRPAKRSTVSSACSSLTAASDHVLPFDTTRDIGDVASPRRGQRPLPAVRRRSPDRSGSPDRGPGVGLRPPALQQ